MRRVLVVGNTNAGKTTMARKLAARLGVPHIELDALFWEPGWVEADTDVLLERVAAATSGEGWVTCGNYSRAQHVLWPRADTSSGSTRRSASCSVVRSAGVLAVASTDGPGEPATGRA
jgi:adenylate kinase family enzyme